MQIPTIAEASREIAEGRLSPVALAEACLARLSTGEPKVNAFIRLTKDAAIAAARTAAAEIKAGRSRGPLHGIPFAHKDIYGTAGIPTTAHSKLLADYVPMENAFTVEKLAAAGVVSFGKLATHEFAWGGPSFDLPWPPARNPWNTAHFPGGSSSGTGAAVAAGFVLGGTGSDTGGSIRLPASFCGLAGIKPTYGLCSRTGIQPLAFTLDHAGPLAWTVEDCAILLEAMAGHDPNDPASLDAPVPRYRELLGRGVAGLRIGIVRHFYETDIAAAPEVGSAMAESVRTFERLGARVGDVELPPLQDWAACGMLIMIAEAYAVHEPWLKSRFNDYGELFRDRVVHGAFISSADYLAAARMRRELRQSLAKVLWSFDLLILPTTPSPAPLMTEVTKYGGFEQPNLTMPFNVAGTPALALCNGFSAGGLPLSLQIVGRPLEDAMVLAAGHAYEQATEWRGRRPEL
ncbi:MAG: amidase [Hyphomicrobiaceae bacterium]|nr:amidase [Hyphomicrobiaceae bacterium]